MQPPLEQPPLVQPLLLPLLVLQPPLPQVQPLAVLEAVAEAEQVESVAWYLIREFE